MSIELKIKSKHLSVEAQIIRFEERKLKAQRDYLRSRQAYEKATAVQALHENLSLHRRWDVRNENRSTFLARAYLSGKRYSTIEAKTFTDHYTFRFVILPRVLAMVNKYGKLNLDMEQLEAWTKN